MAPTEFIEQFLFDALLPLLELSRDCEEVPEQKYAKYHEGEHSRGG